MRRLLLTSTGDGSFTSPVDPVELVRGIVAGGPPAADGYAYGIFESGGTGFATAKIIDDGAGGYLGIYMVYQGFGTHFDVRLATSTDLLNWTYEVTLDTNANLPTIARRADGSFVTAWSDEDAAGGWLIRVRTYADLADLLAGTFTDNALLARSLASGGNPEQVPNIFDPEDPMDIGFAYATVAGAEDRAARGTLTGLSGTGYTSWVTAAETAMNAAILGLDPDIIAVGDWDRVTHLGETLTFAEGQILTMPGPYGAFHVYYWNGATAVQEMIATHGGSTEFANPTVQIVEDPLDHDDRALVVAMFLHVTGAASGEYGEAVWYKRLPA